MIAAVHAWASTLVHAQENGLTSEFSRLSAKERTRLAREESEAALRDTAFQATMARAEGHFQARRYEAAMADYEHARAIRPLNVYPPVKIGDLRVLIAKRDAAIEQARADSSARAATSAAVRVQEHAPPPASPAEQAPVRTASPAPPDTAGQGRSVTAPKASAAPPPARPAPRTPVSVIPKEQAPAAAVAREPGIHEEQFKEGNAIVLQRTVTTPTEVHVYRKVTHPWGRTFHFLDGLPVDERAWTDRFGDR